MICSVLSVIEKYNMINKGDSIAVGFSGGADSVCLLHFLSSLKEKYGITLYAVHINHNIRGKEAERDEHFAADFCKNHDIEFISFSVDVPALAKETGKSEEECGRDVRYECFRSLKTDKIAVAHTLSDSAETLLFNLARGTGMKGLCGISPVRGNIIRPLIECTREDIEDYCKSNSLDYVTDSTNLETEYARNKLRHLVIPVLKEINPSFEKSVLRLTQGLLSENAYMENEADKLIDESAFNDGYLREVFLNSDEVIVKRALYKLISQHSQKSVCEKHISLCFDALIKGEGSCELSKGVYFSSDANRVYFRKTADESLGEKQWCFGIFESLDCSPFEGFTFEIAACKGTFENCCLVDVTDIDCEKLFIRSRKIGDKFSSSKRHNTKTLKKLFNERKIPKDKRNKVAVISYGDDVLWVDGFGTDSKYELKDSTEKVLIIKKRIDK